MVTVIMSTYEYDGKKLRTTIATTSRNSSAEYKSIKDLCLKELGEFDSKKLKYKNSKKYNVNEEVIAKYTMATI